MMPKLGHSLRLFFILLVIGSLVTLGAATRDRERTLPSPHPLETYEAIEVLSAGYGDDLGQFGITQQVEDQLPVGPSSFAVDMDTLVVLDPLNGRLQRFAQHGSLLQSITFEGASDIVIDADRNLHVLDAGTNSVTVFASSGKRAETIAVPNDTYDLRIDARGRAFAQPYADAPRLFHPRSARETATSAVDQAAPEVPQILYTTGRLHDHAGYIENTASGKRLMVPIRERFGSMHFLATDDEGNVYVLLEQLLAASDEVIDGFVEVRKYTSHGQLRAVIPIEIKDYAVVPHRDVVVTPDGAVYHLRPLAERVVIEKWTPTTR